MKKIILLLTLISLTTCFAQQIYPLNTYYKNAPNYAYLKDLDNRLPQYVGTYKTEFNGNEISLFITYAPKELIDTRLGGRFYYQDVLNVKYIVKKLDSDAILQDTQNQINLSKNEIKSIATNTLDNHSVALIYTGTNCEVGFGRITLKKPNANQLIWSYYPDSVLLTNESCPGKPDITIYIPDARDLVFTKQKTKKASNWRLLSY